jgi:hypothetical protein
VEAFREIQERLLDFNPCGGLIGPFAAAGKYSCHEYNLCAGSFRARIRLPKTDASGSEKRD